MNYIAGLLPPHIQPQTNPTSREARDVDRESMQALAKVKLGSPGHSRAMDELTSAVNARGMLKTFIGLATYERAAKFLTALPTCAAAPELSVDPDGEIAFDWAAGEDMLSISLNASGRISYAADIGGQSSSGPGFFGGVVPEDILGAVKHFG
jgi:hypothetical protein